MPNTLPDVLSARHILIISHVYATGPSQDLESYLAPRVASLVFIGHPFPYAPDRRSFWRRTERGRVVREGTFVSWRGPELSFYLKDVFLTLFWAWRKGPHYDLAVCADPLNAFCGLLLRAVGRVNRVVFYSIDWVRERFPNRVGNAVYHLLDRLAVARADETWNLSSRMTEARAARGIPRARQRTVPIGVFRGRFPAPTARPAGRTLVFLGHLREGHGLPLLLEAFARVFREFPDARLSIIGDGPLAPRLRAQARAAGMLAAVDFHGFLPDHRDVERLLGEADVAVAPYEPGAFTATTDPGKLKAYLAAALPVVVTGVPAFAAEVAEAGAGVIVAPSATAVARAVRDLFADSVRLASMRQAAYALAGRYDWEVVFPQALAGMFGVERGVRPAA